MQYSTVCLCFEPSLNQRSGITRATCVRGKMRLWVNVEHLPDRGSQLASHCRSSFLAELLAVTCTVFLCVVCTIGTVLFATGQGLHCSRWSLSSRFLYQWMNMFEFKPQLANLARCMAPSSTQGVIGTVIFGRVHSVTILSTFAAFKTHFGYTFTILTSGNILMRLGSVYQSALLTSTFGLNQSFTYAQKTCIPMWPVANYSNLWATQNIIEYTWFIKEIQSKYYISRQ